MLKSTIRAIRQLLDEQRLLALAVIDESGGPYAGLLPFAVLSDHRSVLIHASRMSRHSQGLAAGARVGILLHEQDGPDKDPLQIKRATFECRVHPYERQSADWTCCARHLPAAVPGQPDHFPARRLHAVPARVRARAVCRRVRARGGHRARRRRAAGGDRGLSDVGGFTNGGCSEGTVLMARSPVQSLHNQRTQANGRPMPHAQSSLTECWLTVLTSTTEHAHRCPLCPYSRRHVSHSLAACNSPMNDKPPRHCLVKRSGSVTQTLPSSPTNEQRTLSPDFSDSRLDP